MLTGKTSVFRTNGGGFSSESPIGNELFAKGKFELRVFRQRHFKRETFFKTVIVVLGQAFGARLYLRITLLEMAFRSGLCKLSMPTDIDESEIFRSHRQRLIEEKLLKCYTDEVASEICKLVLLNCNGCRIDNPSQRNTNAL